MLAIQLTLYMTSTRLGTLCRLLQESKATVKCSELCSYLEDLGFQVRDGRRAGHKIVTHPGLPDFYSTSFDCGHGKNPEIKPGYIRNILKTLKVHEQVLIGYLQEEERHESS
jgi:predicted RNA binding protein YcfA (HicA-like mRNA interferase family)